MRLRLGAVEHDLTTRCLVMGVLAGGVPRPAVLGSLDAAVAAAEAAAEGADLLDLGGVAPEGGVPVGEDEELDGLVPLVEAVRRRVDVPLCIDTWRPRVLEAAAAAGASVAADRQGLADAAFLSAAAEAKIAVVLGSGRPPPGGGAGPAGIVGPVRASLAERVAGARAAGLGDERMIIDAGLGLAGQAPGHALALLRESAALADLGPPLLLDVASDRFLGLVLDLDVGERRVAGHAAAALGIARGCRVVRSQDGRGARRVADVLTALLAARLAHVMPGEAEGA